jgi:hypothetical protein
MTPPLIYPPFSIFILIPIYLLLWEIQEGPFPTARQSYLTAWSKIQEVTPLGLESAFSDGSSDCIAA